MTDSANLALTATPPEVKRYQRLKLLALTANTLISFAVLSVFAITIFPRLGSSINHATGGCRWLNLFIAAGLLGAITEAVTLPLAFWSGFVLEHRFQLSNQTFRGWLWRRVKGYLVGGLLGMLLLAGLYAILWETGSSWWLWATLGWLGVTVVLGQLLPVLILPLFYKVSRLDDPGLLERLRRLTQGTTLRFEGIYRLHLSAETKKANAALAGLGRTRRVLLGDTLLEQFTPEEIEVVFAHEVGHHVHHHLPKMIGINVILALAGFWLVDRLLTALAPTLGYSGLADPFALPLLLLVLALFGLILAPAQNALSRFFETQCDRYALTQTHNAPAYRSAFTKLAQINKSDPDPHPLVVGLFYDHPPIRKRLALAEMMLPI